MLTTVLMFVAAVCLSAIAGYYSVLGMASIFAGSAIAVMIMTAILEASKVIVASWLYNNWQQTPVLLKSYLTAAVVVLMLITSIGIFGYLSKAHIEQTLQAQSNFEQIENIAKDIARQEANVTKLEQEIAKLENKGTSNDSSVQQQIDQEQARIDDAYARIQPAIDEQNEIISKEEQRLASGLSLYETQLSTTEQDLANLQQYIENNDVEKLQALVAVEVDGNFGSQTQSAIDRYKLEKQAETQRLIVQIAEEKQKITSAVINAAREEIKRLRLSAEEEIKKSNDLINRLRSQIGAVDNTAVSLKVAELEKNISAVNQTVITLIEQKTKLETEYRKIEAEVGPIKFVAQMFYGPEVDQNILEESVRYMILILIFVFDPLAMLMLIASNQGMRELREKWTLKKSLAQPQVQVNTVDIVTDPIINNEDPSDGTISVDRSQVVQFTSSVEHTDTPTNVQDDSTVHNKTDELFMKLQSAHETRLQKFKMKD
jgi:hypothetical protein